MDKPFKKITVKWAFKQILKKLFHPGRFFNIKKAKKTEAKRDKSVDLQLKHYSDLLHDIHQAQLRYAELILDQILDNKNPVLDAGCGMGGLINLLLQNNYIATGLTPDNYHIEYLKQKYSNVPLIHDRFENISLDKYTDYFGTVITSESLQYMNLEKVLVTVKKVLKSKGRWIVTDYFRIGEDVERSGFRWNEFLNKLHSAKFKVVYEQDVSKNIYPTLAYVYMWGRKLGVPLFDFLIAKLEKKRPGLFYLMEDIIEQLGDGLTQQLEIVNPDLFTAKKKYMLLSIENAT